MLHKDSQFSFGLDFITVHQHTSLVSYATTMVDGRFPVSNNPPTPGLLQLQLSQLNLKKYLQRDKTTQRTTARLSMLCKMRYWLIFHEDAKLQSLPIRTQLTPQSTLTHCRQPLGITTSIPTTQGQLQNGINCPGKQNCPTHWLLLKLQFQTFINTFITLRS